MRPPLKHLEAKMLFSRFIKSAVAFLLLTIGLAAPAYAQFNKPISSGNWYEDRASGSASNNQNLYLSFAQAPTDKFLNITRVSCLIATATNQAIVGVWVSGASTPNLANDVNRQQYLAVNLPAELAGPNKYYTLNQATYLKLGPGRYPSMMIETALASGTTSTIAADCAIVGDLSDN
jgi:hypothetical protein